MFQIVSNPFAEMTQGLSGQQHSVSSIELMEDNSKINDERVCDEYKGKASSGWWKAFLIIIILFSGIGLVSGYTTNIKKNKQMRRQKLKTVNHKI